MIFSVLWFGAWTILFFGGAISTDAPACWVFLAAAAFSYFGFRDAVRLYKDGIR